MRLAFIYNPQAGPNAQYRAIFPMSALQHRGHEIVWSGTPTDRFPIDRLRRCDLLHVYRCAEPQVLELMASLRSAGVTVSWDNDDDISALTKDSPNYRALGGLKASRDLALQLKAMRGADLVTTTSEALEARYRGSGVEHVTVIGNYVPHEFLRGVRPRHQGIVVGWVAATEHQVDAKRLDLNRVLRQLLDEHPQLRVVTVGLPLGLKHERYERWAHVPLAQLGATLRRFDIGLAPLVDIPFNRCRSTVKVKEYAAAGVPWLASPVGDYARLGPKQGGRLVADDRWPEAIDRLIIRSSERRLLALRGRRWAKRQTSDHHYREWERAFEDAIARGSRPRSTPARPRPRLTAGSV